MANIPNPKVTMEFALGSVGWQESHYYVTNVAVDNTTLYAAMKELVAHRVLCLGGNVAVLLVKASQEQLNRDVSYLRRGDIPVAPESGGYPGTSPSYPTTGGSGVWAFQSPHVSWPLKLVDDNQNQLAITYLAGMPASKGQRGQGPFDVYPNERMPGAYIDSYGTYLVGSEKWGVAGRDWPDGAFVLGESTLMTAKPIYVAPTIENPPQIQFTLPNPIRGGALSPGVWIRVGGLKFNSPQRIRLNGSYQVVEYAEGKATVNVPRLKADPQFLNAGWAQAATYTFFKYKSYTINNLTHKKRGRVVSSPAGRVSSR